MSGHRVERVADLIRQTLAQVLRDELRDPRVGFVTVTDVELSPDLKNAKVFVSFMQQNDEAALAALNRATPFVRRALAREARLRFTPELRFFIDTSIETGFRVDELLRRSHDASSDPPSDAALDSVLDDET